MKKGMILSAILLLFCLFTACAMQSTPSNCSVIDASSKGIACASDPTSTSASTSTP
ncbi:MAG TPA: hypothetical protein VHO94_05200 [Oscillospiraceae bacterium]|nr:hypothetical protein [Oscillospiraceae bacterium]